VTGGNASREENSVSLLSLEIFSYIKIFYVSLYSEISIITNELVQIIVYK